MIFAVTHPRFAARQALVADGLALALSHSAAVDRRQQSGDRMADRQIPTLRHGDGGVMQAARRCGCRPLLALGAIGMLGPTWPGSSAGRADRSKCGDPAARVAILPNRAMLALWTYPARARWFSLCRPCFTRCRRCTGATSAHSCAVQEQLTQAANSSPAFHPALSAVIAWRRGWRCRRRRRRSRRLVSAQHRLCRHGAHIVGRRAGPAARAAGPHASPGNSGSFTYDGLRDRCRPLDDVVLSAAAHHRHLDRDPGLSGKGHAHVIGRATRILEEIAGEHCDRADHRSRHRLDPAAIPHIHRQTGPGDGDANPLSRPCGMIQLERSGCAGAVGDVDRACAAVLTGLRRLVGLLAVIQNVVGSLFNCICSISRLDLCDRRRHRRRGA